MMPVCVCEAAGLTADKTATLVDRLRNGLASAAAVQLSDVELQSHQGPQIGALLRERRLESLHATASLGPALI